MTFTRRGLSALRVATYIMVHGRAPLFVLFALSLCLPRVAIAVEPERRLALVIGINAYQNAPALINPANDARAIGDSLRRLKFDVMEIYDADYRALSSESRAFGIRAAGADVAVVYYAGHGVQVDHENYLIPADAKLERERDLLYEAIPVERLLGEVSQAHRIGIVMLDSCRNNPFIDRVARSMNVAGRAVSTVPGLARVDNVPGNTMVVMAAKADQIAEDGQDHSPFAAAVLAHLNIPGLELGLFFRSVRDTVLRATSNRQEPYVFSSLGADPFYLYPRPANRPPQIGAVRALEVPDTAGPTLLEMPQPIDPDQDPLTIRIIGLPHSGEVRVDGQVATLNTIVAAERFQTATYRPDGKVIGPVGTVDLLIEDGRGGSVTASLPISVHALHRPPVVAALRHVRIVRQGLGIPAPIGQDGDTLTVTIDAVPHGTVLNGGVEVHVGDHLSPSALTKLTFLPEAGPGGGAGSLRYRVDNGHGDAAAGVIDIEVAEPDEPKSANEPTTNVIAADPMRDQAAKPAVALKSLANRTPDLLAARLVAGMSAITSPDVVVQEYIDLPASKALAISPEGHGSYRTGGWPNAAIAAERVLEGCQVMYGLPCLLYAQDDKVLSPAPSGEWPRNDMPRARYSGTFDPARIPKLRDDARFGPTVTGYITAAQPKAMAFHPLGLVFAATGARDQLTAEGQALAACNNDPQRKGQDGPCYLYATGNRVVLPRRLTGPDPYTRIAAALRLVRPFVADPAYAAAKEKKALALHIESGRTFRWVDLATSEQAERLALEGCQQQYGNPCVLVASGDLLLAPDPFVAMRHDMERLHYHGQYDIEKVPFLRVNEELKSYGALSGPKAIAVRPLGARAIVVSHVATVAEAERKALQICNNDHVDGACFLYASGNQVVLPDRRLEARR